MPYPHMPATGATPYPAPDQRFIYTATGSETDTFTVTLSSSRPDTNYIASVSLLSATGTWYSAKSAPSSYTTTTIQVITGVAPTAGDVLSIKIEERTS